jgi:hypothetical protein
MGRLAVDDVARGVVKALDRRDDRRDRREKLDEQRKDWNAHIRAGASWPAARGPLVTEDGEVVGEQARDEQGRFAGGLDQGSRRGEPPARRQSNSDLMTGWIRGTFGIESDS